MIYRLKVHGPEAWELLYPLVDSILFAEDENDTHYLWVDASSKPDHAIILEVEERSLPAYDWERQWQEHAPGYTGEYVPLYIAGKKLELLPGPGFGDLSHPTTQLVLEMMQSYVKESVVLDIGCGSGVLSIAASACGAKSVWAIDIDSDAEEHTRKNAERNRLHIHIGSVPEGNSIVVLINMVLSEQEEAMKTLVSIRPKIKTVICSGALKAEEAWLKSLWPEFEVVQLQTKGEWIGATLNRSARSGSVSAH